ncbi:MAG: HAD-IIIA family hydrolase [Anaerolineae bacterium]|nr:HAD-IIIA family hydrolase [Anaerolineae bacterium]
MAVRLLFLDRDGTLNATRDRRPPNVPDEVTLLAGVAPALTRYAEAGWHVVIVTNQGGVAHGYLSEEAARAVLQRVVDLLPVPVAATYLCPHMSGAALPQYDVDCPNRKPRPGFLLEALARFGARAADCLFVGDAITDRQTAQAAGVPFCWADRFFGRPVERGMQTTAGTWFQVREAPGTGSGALILHAVEDARLTGVLTLLPREAPYGPDGATLDLCVAPDRQGAGVGLALLETALGWLEAKEEGCPLP